MLKENLRISQESGCLLLTTFSERIKYLREKNDLSLRELSVYIGISHSMISRYEAGLHIPSLNALRAYAKFFHVSYDFLCDDNIKKNA